MGLGEIYIQLPVWLPGRSGGSCNSWLQQILFCFEKDADAATPFKLTWEKWTTTQCLKHPHGSLLCSRSAGRRQLGNKLATDTGWEGWGGVGWGRGGLDKWLRKLQIISKSSKNVSAKWAEQTEGRGRKEQKRKIIGRESSRCVSGCSPATGSRQEHHFQFLNSSQQTLSCSGTSLLFLLVLFFHACFDWPPLHPDWSTCHCKGTALWKTHITSVFLTAISVSVQLLLPVVSFAFF